MKFRLDHQEKKLDELFKLVHNVKDDEIQAYLSKLLCIRASGLLESSVKNLISEYVSGSSPKPIESFVSKSIKNLTNLRDEKLITSLRSFSDDWANELVKQITDEQRSALNSVITNRNNIAHGENDNITFTSMQMYYFKVKEVIEILKRIIKK